MLKFFKILRTLLSKNSDDFISDNLEENYQQVKKNLDRKKNSQERRQKVLTKLRTVLKEISVHREIIYFCLALQFGFYIIKNQSQTQISIAQLETGITRMDRDLRSEIHSVQTGLSNDLSDIRTDLKEETGVKGTVRRVRETALTVLVTGGAIKLVQVNGKVIVKRVQLGWQNKTLKNENVALKEQMAETMVYSKAQLAEMQSEVDQLTSEKEFLVSDKIGLETLDLNNLESLKDPILFSDFSIIIKDSNVKNVESDFSSKTKKFVDKLKQLDSAAGQKLARIFERIPLDIKVDVSLSSQEQVPKPAEKTEEVQEPIKKTEEVRLEMEYQSKVSEKYKKYQDYTGSTKSFPITKEDLEDAETVDDIVLKNDPYPGIYFADDSYVPDVRFVEIDEKGEKTEKSVDEMNELILEQKKKEDRIDDE